MALFFFQISMGRAVCQSVNSFVFGMFFFLFFFIYKFTEEMLACNCVLASSEKIHFVSVS